MNEELECKNPSGLCIYPPYRTKMIKTAENHLMHLWMSRLVAQIKVSKNSG